jgi:hypothetical protein
MDMAVTWMVREECERCRGVRSLREYLLEYLVPSSFPRFPMSPRTVVCTNRLIRDIQKCCNSSLSSTYALDLGMARKIEENAERGITGVWQQLIYAEAISGGMLRCRETSNSPDLRAHGKLLLGCVVGGAAMLVWWNLGPAVKHQFVAALGTAVGRQVADAMIAGVSSYFPSGGIGAWISRAESTATFLAAYIYATRTALPQPLSVLLQGLSPALFEDDPPTVCSVRARWWLSPQSPAVDPPKDSPPGLPTPGVGPPRSPGHAPGQLEASAFLFGQDNLEAAPEMNADVRREADALSAERPTHAEERVDEDAQEAEPEVAPEKEQGGEAKQPLEILADGLVNALNLPKPDDASVGFLSQFADADGWLRDKKGMVGLSMKAFRPDVVLQKDKVAPMLMRPPRGCRLEHWASCDENISAALYKRAVAPTLPYTLEDGARRQLRKQMQKLCETGGPFSKERIGEWASKVLTAEDLNPKSWTFEKWRREHKRALLDTSMRVSPGIAIKDEILEWLGKNKPRFLLADKEAGQVAARFVIKCFDALWFEWRDGHHLKYQPKHVAMDRVVEDFSRDLGYPTAVCEGDGTAWDSCCNSGVRDDTENIVLYHVYQTLLDHPLFMEHLGEAHQAVCESDKLVVKGPVKLKSDVGKKWVINAIRRSGHAGTSGLNGFINAVLWSFTLTPEVCRHLQAGPRQHVASRYRAVGGEVIKVSGTNSYEGDDSLLLLPETLRAHEGAIEERWKKYGFHMKIFWRTDGMCTYTGYDFLVRGGRLTGAKVPSIRRNVLGCTFSISPVARDAWQRGKVHEVHRVAADTMLARATAFEMDCPPLAHVYCLLAEYFAARVRDYTPSDLNREHKRCEDTLADTVKRIRGNQKPPADDQIVLWRLSMAGLPGDVPQLQALTGVTPESQHFLHAVA